jgi:hypothetical protein
MAVPRVAVSVSLKLLLGTSNIGTWRNGSAQICAFTLLRIKAFQQFLSLAVSLIQPRPADSICQISALKKEGRQREAEAGGQV